MLHVLCHALDLYSSFYTLKSTKVLYTILHISPSINPWWRLRQIHRKSLLIIAPGKWQPCCRHIPDHPNAISCFILIKGSCWSDRPWYTYITVIIIVITSCSVLIKGLDIIIIKQKWSHFVVSYQSNDEICFFFISPFSLFTLNAAASNHPGFISCFIRSSPCAFLVSCSVE